MSATSFQGCCQRACLHVTLPFPCQTPFLPRDAPAPTRTPHEAGEAAQHKERDKENVRALLEHLCETAGAAAEDKCT